ncbi:MAG: V-type ATP synthase subunit I [Synergistaceae bacterium]|jgi:V/A-type H+-transporting ATPase subunit I|nr:V-type ATP synthase subunit I [Synergistaceae bacterium]
MAIESMQKVRLAAHKSISEEVADNLQKLGCCQFIPQNREKVAARDEASLKDAQKRVDELLADVRFVMRFLEPYATEKGGGLAKALGDVPSYTTGQLASLASENDFLEAAKKVRNLEKRSSDARSGLSRVAGAISLLSPLAALPYSLDFYTKGTDLVQGTVIHIASAHDAEFRSAVSSSLGDSAEIFALPAAEKDSSRMVSIIYARSMSSEFQNVLSKFQTSKVDVPAAVTALASDELSRLENELAALKADDAAVTGEITDMANAAYKLCQYCSDWWSIKKDKLDALLEGEQTEQIALSSFWIPSNCIGAFRQAVAPFGNLTEIVMEESSEDDKPPTLLRNKSFADPIEPLITMYGIPTYGGFDPTAVVAPFFYAFFGICFGDAGYGLLVAGLLMAIMMKHHLTGATKKFCKILIIGNICALIFGAMTFSWFGDSFTSFPFLRSLAPAFQKLQILDPMKDPMTMLYVSLVLGFIQIMFGLLIAMKENLRKGDKMAAFSDQGGWIVFLCGLIMIGLSAAGVIGLPTRTSAAVAAIGALMLIATQGRTKTSFGGKLFSGVMSLYNVTSYLGDLLSYSRLLALGLGSAAVGMVINLLANLVAGSISIRALGIVLGALIFVLGHLFGIAVNILGAFIHSLRLQYVEFFSKFHEASGEEFVPFALRAQYVKLSGKTDA